jgi:hypothetical protein
VLVSGHAFGALFVAALQCMVAISLDALQIEKTPESTDFEALTRVLVVKAKSSDDATRYTAIRWLNCFLSHCIAASQDSMMTFMADLIIAVLPCLSHANKDIKDAAVSCNSKLLTLNLSKHLASVGIGPVLTALSYELSSQQQPTRLESLRWFQVLLEHNKAEVLQQWPDIMPALLDALTSPSDAVVKQVRPFPCVCHALPICAPGWLFAELQPVAGTAGAREDCAR